MNLLILLSISYSWYTIKWLIFEGTSTAKGTTKLTESTNIPKACIKTKASAGPNNNTD